MRPHDRAIGRVSPPTRDDLVRFKRLMSNGSVEQLEPRVAPMGRPGAPTRPRMKVAIVGTGIAGNVVAHHLAREHDITVFESDARIGGHTNTLEVEYRGRSFSIDTGFIVYNDWTYPNFIALLDALDVESHPTTMSFSVRDERVGLEYNGASINSLFAQRRNLVRPSFHRMIRDILRFNREAPRLLQHDGPDVTLDEYLKTASYSSQFIERYIVPMGAAIWSAQPRLIRRIPAKFFIRFFENHGLLSIDHRPTWRVVSGGSSRYVEKLVAGHRSSIRLSTPVEKVRRTPSFVEVKARGCPPERFDQIIFACHSDQALGLLADPSASEREVLGAIRFQANDVVLHTDASLMPRTRLAWAAWNYHIPARGQERVAVTYNMNILQGLRAPVDFCVTLNDSGRIDPRSVIARFEYDHPVFTPDAIAAQREHERISGVNRTYYCGAYWRYGFHEDGVISALRALEQFEEQASYEQRTIRRAS